MKKQYVNLSLEVVEIQQRGSILAGSVDEIDSNADVGYGGAGTGTGSSEPMGREFELEEDFNEDFDDWE